MCEECQDVRAEVVAQVLTDAAREFMREGSTAGGNAAVLFMESMKLNDVYNLRVDVYVDENRIEYFDEDDTLVYSTKVSDEVCESIYKMKSLAGLYFAILGPLAD